MPSTGTRVVGAGGTIGFAQTFADLLKGAPCILMQGADPHTRLTSRTRAATSEIG